MIYTIALADQHLIFGLSSDTKYTTCPENSVFIEGDTGKIYNLENSVWAEKLNSAYSGSSAAWGVITGTLSNQTDLQAALDAKSATSHNHDATYEAKNANIQAHVGSAHAPSDAQKNSDITKPEIEAKLTGAISSHNHAESTITFTDVTTNDVSTTKHGFLPKLPAATGKYLKDDLTWGLPTAATPDNLQTINVTTANTTITAGYSSYIPQFLEVGAGFTYEIGAGSYLEIG